MQLSLHYSYVYVAKLCTNVNVPTDDRVWRICIHLQNNFSVYIYLQILASGGYVLRTGLCILYITSVLFHSLFKQTNGETKRNHIFYNKTQKFSFSFIICSLLFHYALCYLIYAFLSFNIHVCSLLVSIRSLSLSLSSNIICSLLLNIFSLLLNICSLLFNICSLIFEF